MATRRQWGVKSRDLKPLSEKPGERQRAWLVNIEQLPFKLSAIFVTAGWAHSAFLVLRASSTSLESKIYDP